jgi:hypothetical protein
MNDIRSILNLLERKAYTIQSNGSMVNVNVDRSQPKIQIKNKDGEVFDLHGKSEDELKKYIANKNGWEVFEKGKGEASKGGNEKLDAIVAKYAKPGMSLDDVAKMESEAGSRTDSAYVLAHAARTLGLDGLYRANGKGFCYLEGKEVKTAGGANRQQMEDIAEAGLLPQSKVEQAEKVAEKYKESDPEKSARFQKVADKAKGEDPAGAKKDPATNQKLEDAKKKYARFMELLTKAMEDAKSGKPGDTGPNESWQARSYADQLLAEALAADELEELEQLYKELNAIADGEPFGDDLDDQISDAINRYDMWKAGNADQAKQDDAQDNQADAAVDYSSDEQIKKAVDDVEAWIANDMPKELESKQAKGLLKATNRGKVKSASAAAVQTVLMRIGTANNNADLKKIKADGFYGPATVAGVKRAQEIAGIKVDGDAGADTAAELLSYSKNPQGAIDDAMKSDFARIEELLAKSAEEDPAGANKEAGNTESQKQNWGNTAFDNYAKDVAKNAGIQVQSKQFDMRSMLETLSRLDEALSADEYKELRQLLDKHRDKINDPEVGPAYAQYKDLFDKADAVPDPEDPAGAKQNNDTAPPPPEEVNNHEEVARALKAAGHTMFGTDEEKIYRYLEKLKDPNSYQKVVAIYKKLYNRDLTADLQAEMSGSELEELNQILGKLGVGPNAGGGQGKVNSAGIFAIPDASRAELKLDDQKPKFANTKLTPNGAAFYIYHDSAGKTSGPTIKVDSPEGQKLTKMIQDAGGKIINPAAEDPAGAKKEVPKPQGMDPNKLANPKNARGQPVRGTIKPGAASAGTVNTAITQSKDYGMKKAMNEAASMNISMSGDNAGEVGDLLKILKNAGMENAAPVGAIDMPMDTEMPAEPQGPMPCATCGGDHDADSPCGGGEGWDNSPDEDHGELSDIIKLSGGPNSNKNPGDIRIKDPSPYEDVEEDGWDNSPDEEYKDDDYMYQSGGIHKKKKAYAKAQDGDNAMAVESIKDRLYAELAAKTSK